MAREDCGASVRARDHAGKTPPDWAVHKGYDELARMTLPLQRQASMSLWPPLVGLGMTRERLGRLAV